MRSVAGVAWIAPARGRASQTITNIMHTGAAVVVEAQVAAGKNKATSASKATPAIDNWKGRVQREVLVERCARFRCVSGMHTGKGPQMANPRPTPKVGNLGSALATRHRRQPCRLFPRQANQRRPRETDRGDGTRPPIRHNGEATGVQTEIIRPVKPGSENSRIVPEKSTGP